MDEMERITRIFNLCCINVIVDIEKELYRIIAQQNNSRSVISIKRILTITFFNYFKNITKNLENRVDCYWSHAFNQVSNIFNVKQFMILLCEIIMFILSQIQRTKSIILNKHNHILHIKTLLLSLVDKNKKEISEKISVTLNNILYHNNFLLEYNIV